MSNDTALTYAGTSGYSGSDTSEQRARDEDSGGATAGRQRRVLDVLLSRGDMGATWQEVSNRLDLHHGQVSSVLTNLHRAGRIARLKETRHRCKVYVLPDHVRDREVDPPTKRRKSLEREWMETAFEAVAECDDLVLRLGEMIDDAARRDYGVNELSISAQKLRDLIDEWREEHR